MASQIDQRETEVDFIHDVLTEITATRLKRKDTPAYQFIKLKRKEKKRFELFSIVTFLTTFKKIF